MFNVDDLIEKGLVRAKKYTEGKYKGLKVLKYDRKVFFNNLWDLDVRLLDSRGIVTDENDNIILYPFTKVFNYGENEILVDRDKSVQAIRKVNGFMASCSMYNGELIVGTTGTLDSDYAKLAKEMILGQCYSERLLTECWGGYTAIFEICSVNDPHIVDEKEGVYLIGFRKNKIDSQMYTEFELDLLAESINAYRPYYFEGSFSDIKKKLVSVEHEGYMIRDTFSDAVLCKLKSPHYLSKKWLMRMSKKKVESIFTDATQLKQQLDEEYYPLLNYILKTFDKEEWLGYSEQQRRKLIEDYLGEANEIS